MNPNAFQRVCAIRYLLKHCSGAIFRTKHFTFAVRTMQLGAALY